MSHHRALLARQSRNKCPSCKAPMVLAGDQPGLEFDDGNGYGFDLFGDLICLPCASAREHPELSVYTWTELRP